MLSVGLLCYASFSSFCFHTKPLIHFIGLVAKRPGSSPAIKNPLYFSMLLQYLQSDNMLPEKVTFFVIAFMCIFIFHITVKYMGQFIFVTPIEFENVFNPNLLKFLN